MSPEVRCPRPSPVWRMPDTVRPRRSMAMPRRCPGPPIVHGVVGRQPPDDAFGLGIVRLDRQLDAFVPEPDVYLARTLELGELREHQFQRVLDALIRGLFDAIATRLHVAGRHAQEKRAAPGLLTQRLL